MTSLPNQQSQCMSQYHSKWFPPNSSGDQTTNVIDEFVNDIMDIYIYGIQKCTDQTQCVNIITASNCDIVVEDIEQTCYVSYSMDCVSNASAIENALVYDSVNAVIDNYIENITTLNASYWKDSLYNLAYVINISFTQTCQSYISASNILTCKDSTGSIGNIDMCSYVSANFDCIQTTPGYAEAYKRAYHSLYEEYPTPRNAYASEEEKLIVLLISIAIAVVIIVTISLLLEYAFDKKYSFINREFLFWIGTLGWLIMCIWVTGFFWLIWPYQDIWTSNSNSNLGIEEIIDAQKINVIILSISLFISVLLMAISIGYLVKKYSLKK